MRRFFAIVSALALMSACARLPEIQTPAGIEPLPSPAQCRAVFPQGRWQMHHAIEATVPGGGKTILTGVTVLSSHDRTLDSALMTVEGFVLFRVRYDGVLTVNRAVSPFDRPGFAEGLVDDLRLLFFAPEGPLCESGRGAPEERICRYCRPESFTDIVVHFKPDRQIRQYDAHRRLKRSIEVTGTASVAGTSFAKKLMLQRHGLLGYQLDLTLLEALPLDPVASERNK